MDPVEAEHRSGDELLDAVIELGEHAFRQGRASQAGDLDVAAAEHRKYLLTLAEVQRLHERFGSQIGVDDTEALPEQLTPHGQLPDSGHSTTTSTVRE
jgi:hypothetical protein